MVIYFIDYVTLGDFWQANASMGFARKGYMDFLPIISYLIIILIIIFFMAKTITLLKNDARKKKYVFLIGLFYGITFGAPFLIFNLFFNVLPIFPIVKIIESVIMFILTAFMFIYVSRFRLNRSK